MKLLLGSLLLLASLHGTAGRSVTVDVQAPWHRHQLSFIAEVSEFVHDQSPASFWKFSDSMCTNEGTIGAVLNGLREGESHQEVVHEQIADLLGLAYEATSTLVPSSMQSLMSTMIGLGHYLPALQFYETLAAPHAPEAAQRCGDTLSTFAVIEPTGQIVCNPEDLSAALASANEQSTNTVTSYPAADWEHVYPAAEGKYRDLDTTQTAATKAVLYGALGSPGFCNLHRALASAVQAGTLSSYAVRHHFPSNPSQNSTTRGTTGSLTTPLQGYGVLLDIRNMEYKAVDDSATDSTATAVDHSIADWETLGLNFTSILASVPGTAHPMHERDEVVTLLREQLMLTAGKTGSEETMKVWKMHDLGLQTLQLVRTAATQGTSAAAMARLAQLVHNFPQMASMVSATKVSPAVREEVQAWTGSFGGHMALLPPNSLLINGRRTDLSAATFNVFDLLKDIKQEIETVSKLTVLPLPASVRAQVQSIAAGVGVQGAAQQKQVRIDVSKGGKHVVQFINNLEKDPQYGHLPRSLKHLLRPAWSLTALSRNLYTLIVVVDPLSQEGASMLLQMYMMLQQSYPVRCGIVFACSASAASGAPAQPDATSPQEDFCRMFAHMKEKHSMEYATSFALSTAQGLLEGAAGAAVDRDYLRGVYVGTVEAVVAQEQQDSWLGGGNSNSAAAAKAKKAAEADLEQLFPATTSTASKSQLLHWDFISNSTAYLAARNLPLNSYSLNGIVVGGDGNGGGANLGGTIMQYLGREQHHVTMLYKRKVITDKTKSLFGAILSASRAYSRYHPMLDESRPDYVPLEGQVLSAVRWAEPWAATTRPDVSSTTLLHAPLTPAGLKAAATALEWSRKANAAAAQEEQVPPEGAGDEETPAPVPPPKQRVGVVWSLSVGSSQQQCVVTDGAGSCASSDAESDLLAALEQIHTEAVVRLDGGVEHCDDLCTALLATAYKAAAVAASTDIFTVVRQALLSFLSSPTPAEFPEARVAAARTSLGSVQAPNGDAIAAAVTAARAQARLVSSALGGANVAPDTLVVLHNGRKLVVSLASTGSAVAAEISAEGSDADVAGQGLAEEDLVLLTTLEAGRITDSLLPLLRPLLPPTASSIDAALTVSRTQSDLLWHLSAFCGTYNSGAHVSHRFNAGMALERYAALLDSLPSGSSAGSAMVYTVEPPLTAFNPTAASDLQICITVDPLTLAGQRAAALIPLLTEQLQYTVTVVLVPRMEITDFPLQNFYRYVAPGASGSDSQSSFPAARFSSLPRQHVLTVRLDVPEPWNVQAARAVQDSDNLRCSPGHCGDPGSTTEHTAVTYGLKSLLVAGQCFEGPASATAASRYSLPPNGLQLQLLPAHLRSLAAEGTEDLSSLPGYADTLVMQNLGYFQLQANPGLYVLGTAQGRASDLYALQASQPGVIDGTMLVAVRSFEDVIHSLLVHKREGMEHLSLLGDDTDDAENSIVVNKGRVNRDPRAAAARLLKKKKQLDAAKAEKAKQQGLWSTLTNSLFGSSATTEDKGTVAHGDSDNAAIAASTVSDEGEQSGGVDELALEAGAAEDGQSLVEVDNRIHVFSLATGHMYERLLRIMMLSVTRHSSQPVKFWLFENYLSPTFKAAAAVMAAEYGFEVGYVTYKWPQWLTQQTQQQRIIWGYKILFLDVLFPLNVKKVIYVDADQVVRADLAELWHMDLQGHAYAYTPFCTSREETLGFQFWQQGYWKDHLRGRPYHISALYVVDLQRFRRNAVGDSLRAIYDQLSRDPNSLANLDQDLPNYAQHQVPIFSLPQEWLWCESWCSDDSKSAAKTIDLCNNPLHKEPKLDMARRVISGELFNQSWVQLDEEIRQLQVRAGLAAPTQ